MKTPEFNQESLKARRVTEIKNHIEELQAEIRACESLLLPEEQAEQTESLQSRLAKYESTITEVTAYKAQETEPQEKHRTPTPKKQYGSKPIEPMSEYEALEMTGHYYNDGSQQYF